MLRLLSLDFEFLISAGLLIFLVLNIVHIVNIVRKRPNYKWDILEECRYLIPLLIYIVLYVIKSIIPMDNIGYANYLVWFLIFSSFIIHKYNPLLIFDKDDRTNKEKNNESKDNSNI